jgi:molybdopterin molybdotransferase
MIPVSEATRLILSKHHQPAVQTLPLSMACGHILAESIAADRDIPSYDRVTMDGIAIQSAVFRQGKRTFLIQGIQAAGTAGVFLGHDENCVEVMTGAVLPTGADCVIRYEDLEIDTLHRKATILMDRLDEGQNIQAKGTNALSGNTLIHPGTRLGSSEIAVLASVGKWQVIVFTPPRVVIVGTGDELIPVSSSPKPWQIRQSNSYALQGALQQLNIPSTQHHLPDDEIELTQAIPRLLEQCDVLILSGGVSKGKFDFIPSVLEQSGVQKIFHEVAQKPGKPMWFGRSDTKTVFALPGNPVSTLVCYYKYVQPWILQSMGAKISPEYALLQEEIKFKPPLTYFVPVKIRETKENRYATPLPGTGSGDYVNLLAADGCLELPSSQSSFSSGAPYEFIRFR